MKNIINSQLEKKLIDKSLHVYMHTNIKSNQPKVEIIGK